MRTTHSRTLAAVPGDRSPGPAMAERVRRVAASRAGEALAELPSLIRRLRTLLLVLTISIPVFLIALVAILWRLVS